MLYMKNGSKFQVSIKLCFVLFFSDITIFHYSFSLSKQSAVITVIKRIVMHSNKLMIPTDGKRMSFMYPYQLKNYNKQTANCI